jgi:isocitrate/isopropylmalate dehydrogenase
MEKQIAIIEGDGIGPEVTRQSVKVLNAIADRFNHRFITVLFNGSYCHRSQLAIHCPMQR